MIEGAGVYVGPAGWSYADWAGRVYPDPRPRDFDELVHVATMFNLVEVNSTFYRLPTTRMTASWAKRAATRPGFLFTLKAWQGFTHEKDTGSERDARGFLDALEPIREAGMLGAVLFQYPWSFEDRAEARERLQRLAEWFAPVPRVVEVRHASWNHEEAAEFFRAHGWNFCNVDQPRSSTSITGTGHVTGPIGYIRLHGRNREAWFRKGAGRDERYNYLYTRKELETWVRLAHQMAAEAERLFVIANNHFQGKAVVNALQLMKDLTGTVPPIPDTLMAAYPDLGRLSATDDPEPGDAM